MVLAVDRESAGRRFTVRGGRLKTVSGSVILGFVAGGAQQARGEKTWGKSRTFARFLFPSLFFPLLSETVKL